MKKFIAIGLGILLLLAAGYAAWLYSQEQIANPDYTPAIASVDSFQTTPLIAIDGGHENFHQLDGRFAPFASLASHGQYQVQQIDSSLSDENLTMDILVVANANAALGDEEVESVVQWVEDGGSLLLIADHAPFGSYVAPLAERFGVEMGNGFVVTGTRDEIKGPIDFTGEDLGTHPIISSDREGRAIGAVRSFTGQSLSVPEGGSLLLGLPEGAAEFSDRAAVNAYIDGGAAGRDVSDRAQAVALQYGEGRVVVSGEAAMFTSQMQRGNSDRTMGVQEADNEAYTLNVLDWLAGRIE